LREKLFLLLIWRSYLLLLIVKRKREKKEGSEGSKYKGKRYTR